MSRHVPGPTFHLTSAFIAFFFLLTRTFACSLVLSFVHSFAVGRVVVRRLGAIELVVSNC